MFEKRRLLIDVSHVKRLISFLGLFDDLKIILLTLTFKIDENAITVEVENNGLAEVVHEHAIKGISIATIDRNIPTLYCYVANCGHRRLFLFECGDLLSTKKLIQATHARFQRKTSTRRRTPPPLPPRDNPTITRDEAYLTTR